MSNPLIEIIPKDKFTGYDDSRAWGDMIGVYVGYMDGNKGAAFACFNDPNMAAEFVRLWNKECVTKLMVLDRITEECKFFARRLFDVVAELREKEVNDK